MLSMIDGVEQLQTFFGQYLPQLCIAAVAPFVIFAFIAWWDVPVATVLLVADLVQYWTHRAYHEIPFLWRFHAVHHSSEHLDWVAASRLHPLDQTFIRVCGILPVYLLGFSKETFGALIAFEGLLAIFIHANVRWRFGWLEWLIATPAFHHWHHANENHETSNKNFSGLLPWVDWIFGTFYLPKKYPAKYGINEKMPDDYLGQMARPFKPRQ